MSNWCRGDYEFCQRVARTWDVQRIADTIGKTVDEVIERFPDVLQEKKPLPPPEIPDGHRRRYTDEEIAYITEQRARGVPCPAIADKLQRTVKSVESIILRRKIPPGAPRPRLSQAILAYLVERTEAGDSSQQIADAIGCSKSAVQDQRIRLNVRSRWGMRRARLKTKQREYA